MVRWRWRGAVADTPGARAVQRSFDVREDWLAWLPDEKDRFFESVQSHLESSYVIVSISLNDVLTLCREGRLPPAAEQSAIVVSLFDRLGRQLQGVLRAMGEHGRHSGAVPAVIPLRPGFFRSPNAQRIARSNYLISRVLFSVSARFSRKIRALLRIVAGLQFEARYIAQTRPSELARSWTQLEEFHYDLNTCLRETLVVLKSFLCVLPGQELCPFEQRLQARMPRPVQFFLDDRRVSDHNT
jgi:hypothetical protein